MQGGVAPESPFPPTPEAVLTLLINQASSLSDLEEIESRYGLYLNCIHVTALLGRFSHVGAPTLAASPLLQKIERWMLLLINTYTARGIANSMYYFAKLGHVPGEDLVAHMQRLTLLLHHEFFP